MTALMESAQGHLESLSSSSECSTETLVEIVQATPTIIDVQSLTIKSALPSTTNEPSVEISHSTDPPTLAERRKIPASTQKLRLHANGDQEEKEEDEDSPVFDESIQDEKMEPSLGIDSEECLLSRIEKQMNQLKVDPRSISIDNTNLLNAFNNCTHETALICDIAGTPIKEEDKAFWESLIKDYHQAALNAPSELVNRIVHKGIPHQIRGIIWQTMAQSYTNHMVIMYDKLVSGDMGISSYEVTIERDVQQCFDHYADVLSQNQDRQHILLRFLKAYSIYDSRVGYCHGMADLALPLLMNMPENQAFCLFVRLMETYDMRTLFMLNMEGLHLRLHQFQTLLVQMCPQLDAHLTRLSIHPSMYATQWYLTLFTSSLPFEHVMRFYDLVLLEGAMETVMRLAVSIMQKNQETILNMVHFEQVISFLSSRQIHQHESGDALIKDIISLNKAVSRMDDIAESHSKEIEKEKNRAHQMLALRFGAHNQGRRKSNGLRNSWNSSSSPSRNPVAIHDRTVPLLHQQIEDLVTALSQLQKEHTALAEANMSLRMHEMDQEATELKLVKRNAVLEKRVKKYKAKLASAPITSAYDNLFSETAPLDLSFFKDNKPDFLSERKEDHYQSFVDSLRDTGDFGALIAGALMTETKQGQTYSNRSSVVTQKSSTDASSDNGPSADSDVASIAAGNVKINEEEIQKRKKLESALQNVTSELVAIKLGKFEAEQKYEALYNHCEDLNNQLRVGHENESNYIQKIIYLQSELEDCQAERDQLIQEQEEVHEMAMVAKKTSAELQSEKLSQAKEIKRLEHCVRELEEEKKAFFMPRGTFTEEVFAAHNVLFGNKTNDEAEEKKKKTMARRHTVQVGRNFNMNDLLLEQEEEDNDNEYKAKYVESELRCRELEKYLAEAKVKLAELESGFMVSPRGSMQQQRRASSIYAKRSSAASLSMLANRMSTPTSPLEPRGSSESFASSTTSFTSLSSSNYNSKRTSMYARIWNAFGTPVTPINPVSMKNSIMCEEPQIL